MSVIDDRRHLRANIGEAVIKFSRATGRGFINKKCQKVCDEIVEKLYAYFREQDYIEGRKEK